MVPIDLESKIAPMDGNAYVTKDLHEAYHHYLKVVTTNVEGLRMGPRDLKAYQIIQSSQLSYYRTDIVPEAKVRQYCFVLSYRRPDALTFFLALALTVHFRSFADSGSL
jgi:hypothetical protein